MIGSVNSSVVVVLGSVHSIVVIGKVVFELDHRRDSKVDSRLITVLAPEFARYR